MKIKKSLVSVALGATLALGMVTSAFAAANLTFLTVDGGTNATVSQGDTVEAKATFDITTSTDVESMSWELVGSGLPQTCVDVADRIADGTFTSSFDIDTTGASEGTWDVRVKAYGDNDADVSNLCESSDLQDTALFNDRITVVDDNDDNQADNTGTSNSAFAKLQAQIAALIAAIKGGTGSTPAPSTSAKCTEMNMKLVGTQDNMYNDANVKLQGYLLSEGASIPALKAGASFGYKGDQTRAAVSMFNSVNNCH